MNEELKPCPFCGQSDFLIERLDGCSSVVICQGMVDEHSACLAQGPVAIQDDDGEEQPGRDAAIREWNTRAHYAPEHLQGEAVKVVSYLSHCTDGYDPDAPPPPPQEPLMTVAQHQRILAASAAPALTVWCGPMPESNGKSNFTAVLMRKGADLFDGLTGGITIERSEYPDRVQYEADRMRYLIGELDAEPDILAYDPDKHSGYVRPADQVAEPVLERPAKVGAGIFSAGLPLRMVVEAAYRQYEYAQDPPFSDEQIAAVAKTLGANNSSAADGDRPGYDALWLAFGLSRAAFVALPRVMMHDMPDAWQADMARLLDEWEATWVNQPNISSRVQIVDADGRLMKTPDWVMNYRHPDREQLAAMKVPRNSH